MLDSVVVVGASLAGLRAAESLRAEGFAGSLTVVGAEAHLPYRRPPLSKEILVGTMRPQELMLADGAGLEARWLIGRRACQLDMARRDIVLDTGDRLGFDGLVLATGATANRLRELPDVEGVHVLRSLDDATVLRAALHLGRPHVVVVGAGFVGSEVASSCRELGLTVTVVDPAPHPLTPLGSIVGDLCAELQRDCGVDLRLGRSVVAVEGHGRVERVRLTDGTAIEADLVVVGVGVTPETSWLTGSGLQLDNGVVCDETLAAVGGDHIVAAGDVARWPHPLFDGRLVRLEHWTNAVEQGAAAARTLLAATGEAEPFATIPSMWTEQFGVRIQTVGLPALADRTAVVNGSLSQRRFVAVCSEGGRVVGAIGMDMPRALARMRPLIARRAAVGELVSETSNSVA
jgi:NADPH-dependent 2,4-dienoyl-CoA reductase/sulfur reductase-like enzyme